MDVKAMGKAGLTGVRGKVAGAASRPVSRVTPWRQEQIEAVLGVVVFVLATVHLLRTIKRMWEALEENS